MQPRTSDLRIKSTEELIEKFIREIIIAPRVKLRSWSKITHQTPAIKVGYVGQHLASLVTGVQGTGSGARGDDLSDGSEVKSCNKIDQADKCKNCGKRVLRYEKKCSFCGSSNIDRREDSKWLFTIRDESELTQYLEMDRVVLLLLDYPGFDEGNFNDMRISIFEIYPKDPRMSVFCDLLKNHFYNIFQPKLKKQQKTNPMNLHPLSYQFYLCNPIKIFQCTIKEIDSKKNPQINIDTFVHPTTNRNADLKSEEMPSQLLKEAEWNEILTHSNYDNEIKPLLLQDISKEDFIASSIKKKQEYLPYIPESIRKYLKLRDIISICQHSKYKRS